MITLGDLLALYAVLSVTDGYNVKGVKAIFLIYCRLIPDCKTGRLKKKKNFEMLQKEFDTNEIEEELSKKLSKILRVPNKRHKKARILHDFITALEQKDLYRCLEKADATFWDRSIIDNPTAFAEIAEPVLSRAVGIAKEHGHFDSTIRFLEASARELRAINHYNGDYSEAILDDHTSRISNIQNHLEKTIKLIRRAECFWMESGLILAS